MQCVLREITPPPDHCKRCPTQVSPKIFCRCGKFLYYKVKATLPRSSAGRERRPALAPLRVASPPMVHSASGSSPLGLDSKAETLWEGQPLFPRVFSLIGIVAPVRMCCQILLVGPQISVLCALSEKPPRHRKGCPTQVARRMNSPPPGAGTFFQGAPAARPPTPLRLCPLGSAVPTPLPSLIHPHRHFAAVTPFHSPLPTDQHPSHSGALSLPRPRPSRPSCPPSDPPQPLPATNIRSAEPRGRSRPSMGVCTDALRGVERTPIPRQNSREGLRVVSRMSDTAFIVKGGGAEIAGVSKKQSCGKLRQKLVSSGGGIRLVTGSGWAVMGRIRVSPPPAHFPRSSCPPPGVMPPPHMSALRRP